MSPAPEPSPPSGARGPRWSGSAPRSAGGRAGRPVVPDRLPPRPPDVLGASRLRRPALSPLGACIGRGLLPGRAEVSRTGARLRARGVDSARADRESRGRDVAAPGPPPDRSRPTGTSRPSSLAARDRGTAARASRRPSRAERPGGAARPDRRGSAGPCTPGSHAKNAPHPEGIHHRTAETAPADSPVRPCTTRASPIRGARRSQVDPRRITQISLEFRSPRPPGKPSPLDADSSPLVPWHGL
jgi:hypothetical protein